MAELARRKSVGYYHQLSGENASDYDEQGEQHAERLGANSYHQLCGENAPSYEELGEKNAEWHFDGIVFVALDM